MNKVQKIKKAIRLIEALTNRKVSLKENTGVSLSKDQNSQKIADILNNYIDNNPLFTTPGGFRVAVASYHSYDGALRVDLNAEAEIDMLMGEVIDDKYSHMDELEAVFFANDDIGDHVEANIEKMESGITNQLERLKSQGLVKDFRYNSPKGHLGGIFSITAAGN